MVKVTQKRWIYLQTLCFPFNSLSLLKRAESQLTPPLLPDRPHRANTNCSWPYVCVSCLDWINFRCGLCLRLLQRVYCESHPHPPTRPPLLPATVPPISSCVENGHTCTHAHLTVVSHAILHSDGIPEIHPHPPSPYVPFFWVRRGHLRRRARNQLN